MARSTLRQAELMSGKISNSVEWKLNQFWQKKDVGFAVIHGYATNLTKNRAAPFLWRGGSRTRTSHVLVIIPNSIPEKARRLYLSRHPAARSIRTLPEKAGAPHAAPCPMHKDAAILQRLVHPNCCRISLRAAWPRSEHCGACSQRARLTCLRSSFLSLHPTARTICLSLLRILLRRILFGWEAESR